MFVMNQNPYPLISFPIRIYLAAVETMKIAQVTDIIAGTSCLTALSTVAGPNVDWVHPLSGQLRPSVLNQAIAANSGDRKSTADELVCRPIYEHDADTTAAQDEDAKAYARAKARWVAVKKGLLRRLGKLACAGEPTDAIEAQLEAHEALEPGKPVANRIVHQDMTRISAFESLEGNGKAIAMITDEGHTLLQSTVMRHYGFLNQAWDGKQLLTYDRANHENIVVQNPRVTVSFMIQPEVLADFFARRGRIVRSSGFCARYLFARSPSNSGYREPKLSSPLVDLLPLHARMRELLAVYQTRLATGSISRDVLTFDDNAKALWLRIANDVETNFRPGYFLNDISDFGNKYMDMIGRIACLLHYFEFHTSSDSTTQNIEISEDTLTRAHTIASWHLNEYKQLFSPPLQRAPEEFDADRVYSYLYRAFYLRGTNEALKNQVRQYCGVRNSSRLHCALQILMARQAISVWSVVLGTGKKPTDVIKLHQPYFDSCPAI